MKTHTLLVIDDYKEAAWATARMLKAYWKVEVAYTMDEALAKLSVADVILSDWDFPDGGGQRILEVAKVPVVVYTGAPQHRVHDMIRSLGAASVVAKPALAADLDRELVAALERRQFVKDHFTFLTAK